MTRSNCRQCVGCGRRFTFRPAQGPRRRFCQNTCRFRYNYRRRREAADFTPEQIEARFRTAQALQRYERAMAS